MRKYDNRCVKGILRVQGTKFVNGDGEVVALRGYGTGNWQNPEGFMIGQAWSGDFSDIFSAKEKNPPRFDRKRTVSQVVRELCGSEYLSTFWDRWEENHLTEDDIKAMAEVGFNSVRLVLNANALLYEEPGITFNEPAFQRLANVLDWCEKYKIYAILDMHASVGGTNGPCGDALFIEYPSLFTDAESKERTIILWEEICRRFHDRWILAGYDLVNEPVSSPNAAFAIPDLEKFYIECIERMRKIDQEHIFFLEGPKFARGNQIFTHDYDPGFHNWAISIHLYGASPEVKDLVPFLLKGIELDVPIWMGECGSMPIHNAVFFDIRAKLGVGYAMWCWKTAQGPEGHPGNVSFPLPERWHKIQEYTLGGPRPSYQECQEIFDEYLENFKYCHCTHNKENTRINAKEPDINIPGAAYDMFLEDGSRYRGSWEWGNYLNFRNEDLTKLIWVTTKDTPYPDFKWYEWKHEKYDPMTDLALELKEGEYANYSVRNVRRTCGVILKSSGKEAAVINVTCNGKAIGKFEVKAADILEPVSSNKLLIEEGEDAVLTLTVEKGTVAIHELEFKYEA